MRCRIVDGSFHPVDSSELAFKTAARMAFKNAMREAAPVLLEPIMTAEVTTPVEYQGNIVGDLSRRRGQIRNVETDSETSVITAEVPLHELFGYAVDIRSLSKGRAEQSMTPSHYAQLPASIPPRRSRKLSPFTPSFAGRRFCFSVCVARRFE